MAERLFKVAKELNVGVSTIVDFLASKGHIVENRPTSIISDDLHQILLQEFKSSIVEKEKADQIIIGNRILNKDEKAEDLKQPTKPLFSFPKISDLSQNETNTTPTTKEEEIPQKETIQDQTSDTIRNTYEIVGPKIIGKIDLEKSKPTAKKAESTSEPSKQEPATAPDLSPNEPLDEPIEDKKEILPHDQEIVEDIHRSVTPQLKGLKIMGKIDASKLNVPTRPKPVEQAKPAEKQPEDNTLADINKKKRKRKKLPTTVPVPPDQNQNKSQNQAKKQDEPAIKEVSQKEIDEKIKATMARLSTSGKNKRQKLRRDSRETKREKQETLENETAESKLKLTEFISVSELASLLDIPVSQVITTCLSLGIIVSINQRLDAEIIEVVASEFGHDVEFISAEEGVTDEEEIVDAPDQLEPRAPIVTVMGHVDHGKTSLLDFIRSENVVSGEAGGITQHIGAYEVKIGPNKDKITFLDTPGHEAFTAMRARGAKVTDIAVIIIAADDQVMPQTREAISHAQAANVPIIFAINKIDKPGADPEKIKQQLSAINLLVEDWGGTYQVQEISAKSGLNVDKLLEKILLEAEVLDLKANPNRSGVGTVVEASLDKGKGYVTKILVQNGNVQVGDVIVAGPYVGKIKAMFNEFGKKVKKAGPSTPTLILGLNGAPQAGEKFKVMESEQEARQLATKRAQIEREQSNRANKRISLDEIGRRLALGTFKELNLIVKGDVDGSIEALSDSLMKLSVETIQVNVIHKAVGAVVESDILLASASDAIIVGFQVRPTAGARALAEKEGVQIKTYSIIYEAIDEVKAAMEGLLEPTKEEKIVAQVEVKEIFKMSKIGTIAGCLVTEGKITRNTHIRLIRDGIVVFPTKEGAHGELTSLKRFKEDVKEVKNATECGLTIKNFNDIRVGDIVEGYEIIEVKQKLA